MPNKLSFSEYCKSKEYLRLAAENIPQVTRTYELTKYCKFPIISEEVDEKSYIALKPKDSVEIVWEYLNPDSPIAVRVSVITEGDTHTKIRPAWGNTKLSSWVSKNTRVDNK